jgi:uncharacterized protein (DUF885 family)
MRTLPRILLLIAACAPATAWTAAADDLKAVIDQAWEAQLANDPMFASQLGDRRYNDRWADRSLEAIAAAQAQQRDFLRRVYAIDRNALAPAEWQFQHCPRNGNRITTGQMPLSFRAWEGDTSRLQVLNSRVRRPANRYFPSDAAGIGMAVWPPPLRLRHRAYSTLGHAGVHGKARK